MVSSRRLLLPSLPFELIEEILYRTPAESLIRFKSTCKKFYALITNKKFIYTHLDQYSPERFIRYQTSHVIDPVTGIVSDSPVPDELDPERTTYMIHCDGLMLCIYADLDYERRKIYSNIAVWNPASRKIKWIESPNYFWNNYYYGIGYANTCRDNYKILSFSDPKLLSNRKYEIYEFNSKSWRRIDAKFDGDVDTDCEGVSMNGDMYWIALKKEGGSIQCFDFSTETFKFICDCPSYWIKRLGCFNGDRLSLFQQEEDSGEFHVSVTTKLNDGAVSFSRYFNVTSPDLPELQSQDTIARQGYSIGKHRINIVWCEEVQEEDQKWYTCITLYEIDQGGIRKKTEVGRCEAPDVYDPLKFSYVYTPSLIPVPE